MPYMLYKGVKITYLYSIYERDSYNFPLDACNEKSNQKNLGTITCSNLCTGKFSVLHVEETDLRV